VGECGLGEEVKSSGNSQRLSGRESGWVWMEEADDIFIDLPTCRDRKHGGDFLGGISTLQGTDLTGPILFINYCPR